MSNTAARNRQATDEIKAAARGRWPEILERLGNLPADILDGEKHPCVKCGGRDRFRFIDPEAGAIYCNQCLNEKNGDGISALQWANEWDFRTALNELAAYLGFNGHSGNGHGKTSTPQVRPPKADASTLHRAHALLVSLVELSAEHRAALRNRGLRDEEIDRRQYRTMPRQRTPVAFKLFEALGDDYLRVPGLLPPTNGKARSLAGNAGLLIPARDSMGRIIALAIRLDEPKPDKKYVWFSSGRKELPSSGAPAHVPLGIVPPVDRVRLTEGTLKSDVAYALDGTPTIGLAGVANIKPVLPILRDLKVKTVVIAFDADASTNPAVAKALGKATALLAKEGFILEYETWSTDDGKGIDDLLAAGKRPELLTGDAAPAAIRAITKALPNASGCDREIIVGMDESRVVDEAIEALTTRANVYQRGGQLVQVVEGSEPPKGIARPKDAPRIAPIRQARLRELLAEAAAWFKPGDDERERVHPPQWAVAAVEARGQWRGIRRVEAVVEAPILRADGTILQEPGYDEQTGILFEPQTAFARVTDRPTRADALKARDDLLEVVEDFPFASDAHRAAWLSGTMTPVARFAFYSPAPLHLIDANVRGSGKSLLTDAISEINAGREMARMSQPRDDEEFRKRITALAMAGEPLILIDNIGGTLGSPSLDAALTATSWSDRILGATEMASNIPLFATWYATGNNVALAADTARRTLHIRLESAEENPEERSGFQHPHLLAWIRKERPRLAVAGVTILAAYCAAGRPNMKLPPWGSFEAWSDLVRQAIAWVGLPDPGTTRIELNAQADREAVALRQLIDGWREIDPHGAGITVVDVLAELAEGGHAELRAALWELCPPRDGKTLNPRSIGQKLHHLRRRVVGGNYLDRRDTNRGAYWFVRGGGSSDNGDSSDSRFPHTRAHAHTHAPAREASSSTAHTTVTVTPTVTDCPHDDVAETPTSDGYINRQCRQCGQWLHCCRQPADEMRSERQRQPNGG